MSRFIVFSLIITAVVLSGFGFLIINSGAHSHNLCIIALTKGQSCPESDIFTFASFHLNAFKNFSNAVFDNLLGSLVFLFAVLAAVFVVGLAEFKRTAILQKASLLEKLSSPEEEISFWLALHEKSPTN